MERDTIGGIVLILSTIGALVVAPAFLEGVKIPSNAVPLLVECNGGGVRQVNDKTSYLPMEWLPSHLAEQFSAEQPCLVEEIPVDYELQ